MMILKELKPPQLGERMNYAVAGSLFTIPLTVSAILLFILMLIGESGGLVTYANVTLSIIQLIPLLLVYYCFWLLSRHLGTRLLEYTVYGALILYVPYTRVISAILISGAGHDAWVTVSTIVFIILEAILTIILSIAVFRTRHELGNYATALAASLLIQGLACGTVILYIVTMLLNFVTLPLMALYFHAAAKRYGGKKTNRKKAAKEQ